MTTAVDRELVARRGTSGNGRAAGLSAAPTVAFATAEELGAKLDGPVASANAEQQAAANAWIEQYKAQLVSETSQALAADDQAAGLGEQVSGTYVAYDIIAVSPIQFFGNPPHRPHKIVAGGELMLLQALQWINPRVSVGEGFLNPATLQCGGREMRVRFDQLNLTTGVAGPAFTFNIPVLPAVAPTFILFSLFMIAPPVAQTQLIEVNVTSDIVNGAQPFAAFATWHQDVDTHLPWLAPAPANFPPTAPPQLRHNTPMRYMVYPR
jgi:hypothetical protein